MYLFLSMCLVKQNISFIYFSVIKYTSNLDPIDLNVAKNSLWLDTVLVTKMSFLVSNCNYMYTINIV